MSVLNFDELHRMAKALYEETKDMPRKRQKQEAYDEILDFMIFAYILGWYRIDEDLEMDTDRMKETIFHKIDGETFQDRIDKHIDNGDWTLDTMTRLIETECHRCEETAAYYSAKKHEEKTGLTGYKRWITMKDDRVRDTHWYLDETEVILTGVFITFDDDYARFPGDFKLPENNINCRCELDYDFR